MKKIEICFTPALYNLYHNAEANVVVIDIMRATTSICAAFAAGANKIIPVGTVEDAKKNERSRLYFSRRKRWHST